MIIHFRATKNSNDIIKIDSRDNRCGDDPVMIVLINMIIMITMMIMIIMMIIAYHDDGFECVYVIVT